MQSKSRLQQTVCVTDSLTGQIGDLRIRWVTDQLRRSNLVREVCVEALADSVHLSRSRFCHLFRSELGVGPSRYVKLLRLEKARYLFENSFLQVKEIANAAGFGDVSHFVRDYKSVYGERPSETRVVGTRHSNSR
jgi:transcriptional regulator GlxA family with amidase domain